jgi:pentatricopeptide repeat protein
MDGVVTTALVDMYAKCGSLDAARQVFAAATPAQRDVFAYTAMISGLSDHGRCREAMELFGEMQAEGVRPNEVTFICVLTACGRAGLVGRAREIFRSMAAEHGVQPGVEHYGCLVDVLGRAGRLREALAVVRSMPMRPDSYVLGALLSACAAQGDVDFGKQVVEWLAERGLDHSGVRWTGSAGPWTRGTWQRCRGAACWRWTASPATARTRGCGRSWLPSQTCMGTSGSWEQLPSRMHGPFCFRNANRSSTPRRRGTAAVAASGGRRKAP